MQNTHSENNEGDQKIAGNKVKASSVKKDIQRVINKWG